MMWLQVEHDDTLYLLKYIKPKATIITTDINPTRAVDVFTLQTTINSSNMIGTSDLT